MEPEYQHGGLARGLAFARFFKYTRYLAYSNELGESFRKIYPHLVKPSYALAFGYIGLDITNKFAKPSTIKGKFINGGDAILWHGAASLALPGIAIHQTVHHTHHWLDSIKFSNLRPSWRKHLLRVQKFGPTIIGLGMIPLIVHPIDVGVEWVMDKTIRQLYSKDLVKE